jgi:hypothetical protein
MKIRCFVVSVTALLFSVAPGARARAPKADVYFGYSRVGANMYGPYTSGMNGWQLAMHVKPMPFIGIEGDVSCYTQNPLGLSEQVTLAMFGPRVTFHAPGLSLFAHALGGVGHESAAIPFYPTTSYNAASYALGAGADVPLFLGFKLRITGDYLGNSNAPASSYSPSHYRAGVGLAYHI